jgi:hypothetical protein
MMSPGSSSQGDLGSSKDGADSSLDDVKQLTFGIVNTFEKLTLSKFLSLTLSKVNAFKS